jgi:hypothetical protein
LAVWGCKHLLSCIWVGKERLVWAHLGPEVTVAQPEGAVESLARFSPFNHVPQNLLGLKAIALPGQEAAAELVGLGSLPLKLLLCEPVDFLFLAEACTCA